MLAEVLTLRFGEDLREVFKRHVAESIGMDEKQWAWRNNQFRAKTIDGLASREFASGITITHRALARIGYLYLRDGNWNGRQVLSSLFVRLATRPTPRFRARDRNAARFRGAEHSFATWGTNR